MVGENLLDRIKKIRSGQKQQKTERKVRHLTHRPFSEKVGGNTRAAGIYD